MPVAFVGIEAVSVNEALFPKQSIQRVRTIVVRLDVIDRRLEVDLRGRQARVPQQLLDREEVDAVLM